MGQQNERCGCGAVDCVACRGPSARFVGLCRGCEHAVECDTDTQPGGVACALVQRAKARQDDAAEKRAEERRHGRARDEA